MQNLLTINYITLRAEASDLGDSGGGATPPPATDNTVTPPAGDNGAPPPATEANPFDFDYNIADSDDSAANGDTTPDDSQGEEGGDATPYTLDLGEHYAGSDELSTLINTQAQELGLPAAGTSKFLQTVLGEMVESNKRQQSENATALRKEWGRNFDTNLKETQNFIARMGKQAGIPPEALRMFNTRDGMVLARSIMGLTGERGSAASQKAPVLSGKDMARDMRTNPNNPYYEAIVNPQGVSREARIDAAKKYNQACGFPVYPES